jgi:hypothetical protein
MDADADADPDADGRGDVWRGGESGEDGDEDRAPVFGATVGGDNGRGEAGVGGDASAVSATSTA